MAEQDEIVYCALKSHKLRDEEHGEIERLTKAFLENGGTIQAVPADNYKKEINMSHREVNEANFIRSNGAKHAEAAKRKEEMHKASLLKGGKNGGIARKTLMRQSRELKAAKDALTKELRGE